MNEDQDVVKSIELQVQSPAASLFGGAFLAFVFGIFIIAPFIATDGWRESGVAFAAWYAGLAIAAAFIVWCGLRNPRRVFITTNGIIRFDSLIFQEGVRS